MVKETNKDGKEKQKSKVLDGTKINKEPFTSLQNTKSPPPVPEKFQYLLKNAVTKEEIALTAKYDLDNTRKIVPQLVSEKLAPSINNITTKKEAVSMIKSDVQKVSYSVPPPLPPRKFHTKPKLGVKSRTQKESKIKFDPNVFNRSLIEDEPSKLVASQKIDNIFVGEGAAAIEKKMPPPLPARKKLSPVFTAEQLKYNAEIADKYKTKKEAMLTEKRQ